MIVYHGSFKNVDRPLILKAKRPLDFGGGFYVTSNKEQAVSWAIKVSYRNASKSRSVNIYDFDYENSLLKVGFKRYRTSKKDICRKSSLGLCISKAVNKIRSSLIPITG